MSHEQGSTFRELRAALEAHVARLTSPGGDEPSPVKAELLALADQLEARILQENPAPPEESKRSHDLKDLLSAGRSELPWKDRGYSFADIQELLLRDLAVWRERLDAWQAKVDGLRQVVCRVREVIETAFPEPATVPSPSEVKPQLVAVHRLSWRLLPKGPWNVEALMDHFREMARQRRARSCHLDRLERLASLQPSECYVGVDEFRGYVAFCFEGTSTTVLDNPLEGNALYVITSGWRELSRLCKRALLTEHPSRVRRLVHRGDWFRRLCAELDAARE